MNQTLDGNMVWTEDLMCLPSALKKSVAAFVRNNEECGFAISLTSETYEEEVLYYREWLKKEGYIFTEEMQKANNSLAFIVHGGIGG